MENKSSAGKEYETKWTFLLALTEEKIDETNG